METPDFSAYSRQRSTHTSPFLTSVSSAFNRGKKLSGGSFIILPADPDNSAGRSRQNQRVLTGNWKESGADLPRPGGRDSNRAFMQSTRIA
jgi:hypothetical protein